MAATATEDEKMPRSTNAFFEGGLNTMRVMRGAQGTYTIGAFPKKGRIMRVRIYSNGLPGTAVTADVRLWGADGVASTSLAGVVDLTAAFGTADAGRRGLVAPLTAPPAARIVAEGQLADAVIAGTLTSDVLIEIDFEPRA